MALTSTRRVWSSTPRGGIRLAIRFAVFSSTQPLMRARAFSASVRKSTGSGAAP